MDTSCLNKIPFGLITFCALSLLLSCGPRSGIHNDEKPLEQTVCEVQATTVPDNIDGGKLFKQNCAVCHSAASEQVFNGPGMAGIADRLPAPAEEWFVNYTLNNEKVFLSGDPYAAMLHDRYKENRMTVFEGILTEQEVREIYYSLMHATPKQTLP